MISVRFLRRLSLAVPVRSRFGWAPVWAAEFLYFRCGRSPLSAFAAKYPCDVGV